MANGWEESEDWNHKQEVDKQDFEKKSTYILPEEKKKIVDEILWEKENQLLESIAADAKAFLTIQKEEE